MPDAQPPDPARPPPFEDIASQFQSTRSPTAEPAWFLFCEWMAHLLSTTYPSLQSTGVGNRNAESGSTWKCTTTDNAIGVQFDDLPLTKAQRVLTWGITPQLHLDLRGRAETLCNARRFRQLVWHATFHAGALNPQIAEGPLHFLRSMDHARRAMGRLGLGSWVVLDFVPTKDDKPDVPPFSPVNVRGYFTIGGAFDGPYTSRMAREVVASVRACTSFCLGTPLSIGKFRALSQEEESIHLASLAEAPVRLQLAVESFPIGEALQAMTTLGAKEAASRTVRAMACFETAMQQCNVAACTIHLVSAIEALARPNYERAWNNRVTQRYQQFLMKCVPDKLAEILKSPHLGLAFPGVRSEKKLVEAIYKSRSDAVHNGHIGEYHDISSVEGAIRVMLIADIVRAAIIEFAKSPFSSLVGHPSRDKDISIKLDSEALALFRKRANEQGMRVEEYIATLAT